MSEKTNLVMGILQSKSLQTGRTIKLANQLVDTIKEIDELIRFQVLPQESAILELARINFISQDIIVKIGILKLHLDSLIQSSYSLISKIKTALT
jgi:hypothetical protein